MHCFVSSLVALSSSLSSLPLTLSPSPPNIIATKSAVGTHPSGGEFGGMDGGEGWKEGGGEGWREEERGWREGGEGVEGG